MLFKHAGWLEHQALSSTCCCALLLVTAVRSLVCDWFTYAVKGGESEGWAGPKKCQVQSPVCYASHIHVLFLALDARPRLWQATSLPSSAHHFLVIASHHVARLLQNLLFLSPVVLVHNHSHHSHTHHSHTHTLIHMDECGGPLLRLDPPWAGILNLRRTVEPCALRLALPRWSAPYFQHPCHRIILQITAPRSHMAQPISGIPPQGFVSYPTHAGRTLSASNHVVRSLTTCGFSRSRDLLAIYQKVTFRVSLDSLSLSLFLIRKKQMLRLGLKIAHTASPLRLLDIARAGHLTCIQDRELAWEQEPSPQTWTCRR